MSIRIDQSYSISEAERSKFAQIDDATLSSLGYPVSSGRGKWAVLTYNIGSGSLSAAPMFITQTLPNAIQIKSQTIAAINSAVITFTPTIESIEIFNNSDNDIYMLNSTISTFASLTGSGIPVKSGAYYSIDKNISICTIGNPTNDTSDIRIIGHYRL